MRRPAAVSTLVLALTLAGCAMPSWVPFIGQKEKPPEPRRVVTPGSKIVPSPVVGRPVTTPAPPDPDDRVADRIVAVVNNDAITLAELQESITVFRQENREQTSATDEELSRQFLTKLIDNRLQLQEAEREKIVVEDTELNEELTERMKRFGSKTVEEFEVLVRAQGLTIDAVKKRLRDSLRVGKLVRRRVSLRVSVTDPEIAQYIDENRAKLETGLAYHARHVLIVPQNDADAGWEAARIRADLIRTQIVQGADFADLARQNSRDASAKDGGDLGTLHRGELSREIEERILALRPGELSQPYRSALGYHVFRLESKDALEGETLQQVRQQVREILFRQKFDARLEVWLKEIKGRAIIEVRM
jgi:peptidyl-prolyl cis-trans isomerase SurA